MIYQLPSGKVINLSVEQYLEMSDSEIQEIICNNYGSYIESPFYGSSAKINKKTKKNEDIDTSIDFIEDNEEIIPLHSIQEIVNSLEELLSSDAVDFFEE